MDEQQQQQQEKNKSSRLFRQGTVRFGLIMVLLLTLPIAYYLGFEAAPEEYRPLFMVEKPGMAAVRALSGPVAHVEEVEESPPPNITPPIVKGIYMTASTAGYKKRFYELLDLVERTEINSLVIDIKNHDGDLAFRPESESLKPHVAEYPTLGQLSEFTAPLKERGIYLIARQFVFQDPALAEAKPEWAVQNSRGGLWRDYRGMPWLDPASKDVWRYNVAVAREVFAGGFDEIQFDYIRFPSDGNLATAVYPAWDEETPKTEIMKGFFTYLDKELRVKHGILTSVDLFGLTMWHHDFDLNIGQRLVDALPHFDFISPMVYPSHYPAGFDGLSNPADNPYEIIYQNLVRGQEVYRAFESEAEANGTEMPKLATIRPWIQDFDLGAVYTPDMVRAQMTATEDGDGSGWLIWNARNVYTEAALAPVEE